MAFIDYYKILGVDKTIAQKDVKKAYLKRAKQFHPDLHPDDPKAKAKFQALTEAYDVIGDPEKRAKYDKYGEQWKQAEAYEKAGGGGFGGFGGAQGNPFEGFDFSSFGSGGAGGFSSFFQDLFGGGMRGGHGFGGHTTYKEEPKNTQATVTIDMYTALLGGDILVTTGSGERRYRNASRCSALPLSRDGTILKATASCCNRCRLGNEAEMQGAEPCIFFIS